MRNKDSDKKLQAGRSFVGKTPVVGVRAEVALAINDVDPEIRRGSKVRVPLLN